MPLHQNRRARRTTGAVATTLGVATLGLVFGAFSDTTVNDGNVVSTGTVSIEDNDSEASMFGANGNDGAGLRAGQSVEQCIRVTYTGSLAAAVRLYVSSGPISDGEQFTVQVERGGGTTGFDDCIGFTPTSVAVSTRDLSAFQTAHFDYGSGADGKAGAATWAENDTQDYRFTITAKDDGSQGGATSNFDVTWEARA